jgi:spore maturation protein CgeB
LKIFVFGSSITSAYWNGAATYYRGIYKELHALGHEIAFAEPDIYGRQQKRDHDPGEYVDVLVYDTPGQINALLERASRYDILIKHSGVGAEDELLEREVLQLRSPQRQIIFWDVDAPATLDRVEKNLADAFRALVPQYDYILTYGGGPPVVEHYLSLGAAACIPVYNALDPATHHPVPPENELICDLLFVGHRLPDRERRVEEFFLRAAELAPEKSFFLGGEGWSGKPIPRNVRWIGHVSTRDHNRANCSAGLVLNINRESMVNVGFSPPTRVFEAAGAGACVITDYWAGIEEFFAPGSEILVARSGQEVASLLRSTPAANARRIGERMRQRALRDHCYVQRARQVDQLLKSKAAARLAVA